MTKSPERRYFLLGGKGGVGKTSLAASLAVQFAHDGHPTLVVSTDPAHSLSDSLAQDVSGGQPVLVDVQGIDTPLYGMEVNPEDAQAELKAFASSDGGGKNVTDFMSGMGLGMLADQLADLKLGELLDTPPPGLDEAVAIGKVVSFLEDPKYARFTRVVFDTAPTGHTLRLLSLPDFLDKSIGKIVRLRQKLASTADAIKGLFGAQAQADDAVVQLEALKARLLSVRQLFRNAETTEFVIAAIPTVLAVAESSRLLASLRKEAVPVRRIVINQMVPERSALHCKFCEMRRKDQLRAMKMLSDDAGLRDLELITAPLFDVEIRGVPALKFMADQVWV